MEDQVEKINNFLSCFIKPGIYSFLVILCIFHKNTTNKDIKRPLIVKKHSFTALHRSADYIHVKVLTSLQLIKPHKRAFQH